MVASIQIVGKDLLMSMSDFMEEGKIWVTSMSYEVQDESQTIAIFVLN